MDIRSTTEELALDEQDLAVAQYIIATRDAERYRDLIIELSSFAPPTPTFKWRELPDPRDGIIATQKARIAELESALAYHTGPHGESCKLWTSHEHGYACAMSCPTCHGMPLIS